MQLKIPALNLKIHPEPQEKRYLRRIHSLSRPTQCISISTLHPPQPKKNKDENPIKHFNETDSIRHALNLPLSRRTFWGWGEIARPLAEAVSNCWGWYSYVFKNKWPRSMYMSICRKMCVCVSWFGGWCLLLRCTPRGCITSVYPEDWLLMVWWMLAATLRACCLCYVGFFFKLVAVCRFFFVGPSYRTSREAERRHFRSVFLKSEG